MRRDGVRWSRWIGVALALAVIAVVVSVLARGRALPDEPQPVAWNHQACAHCRMAVGEPAHAAQLVTADGDALFFDDPGCLMQYLDEHAPRTHRIWFHDRADERWIAAADVGFLPGAATPMGFGLAATDRGTPGAMSLAEARRWIAARRAGEPSDSPSSALDARWSGAGRATGAPHPLPSHAGPADHGAPAGDLP